MDLSKVMGVSNHITTELGSGVSKVELEVSPDLSDKDVKASRSVR